MSRIGKKPIKVPAGVNVSIKGEQVTVEKGSNRLSMTCRPEVDIKWSEGDREINCSIPEDRMGERQYRAYWGLTRSLIDNMIIGVSQGYEKKLEVVGVGWGAKIQGNKLLLDVGYCKTVEILIPTGIVVTVERQIVTIKGCDKHAVGQLAAKARSTRKPEPYNGKGVRYFGEQIIRKEGKAVAGR
jgi:large subunit ribosomal protein L6